MTLDRLIVASGVVALALSLFGYRKPTADFRQPYLDCLKAAAITTKEGPMFRKEFKIRVRCAGVQGDPQNWHGEAFVDR